MELLSKVNNGKKNKAKDAKTLNVQINELKQQLEEAHTEIAIKEKTLNEIAKQNEILYGELKQKEGLVRNLKQQLEDERWFYHTQNSYQQAKLNGLREDNLPNGVLTEDIMLAQMEKLSKAELCRKLIQSQRRQSSLYQRMKKMEASSATSTEIIYNLCIKFFRMKYLRDVLQKRLSEEAEERQLEVQCSEKLLADIKEELERTVQQCYHNNPPPSSTNAVDLQMITKNGRLLYENALLQLEVRRLQKTIRKSSIMHSRHIHICMDALVNRSNLQDDEESFSGTSCSSSAITTGEEKNEMDRHTQPKDLHKQGLPKEASLFLRTHSTPTLNLMEI